MIIGSKILLILLLSGALSIAISSFEAYMYFSGQSEIVGQSLVDDEFPSQTISPIYVKPVTILMISTVVAWYCIIEITKEKLSPNVVKRKQTVSAIIAILIVIAVISFYEVLFNFFLWGSLMAKSDPSEPFNPDTFVNQYPSEQYRINLTFATKIGVTIFGCSLYGIYVFKDLQNR